MNEEYLWNKTGSDAEIERLELSLKNFAFKTTTMPELPPKQILVSAPRSRPFFALSFGFGVACVLVAAFGAMWFLAKGGQPAAPVIAIEQKPQITAPVIAPHVELAIDRDSSLPKAKIRPQTAMSKVATRKTVRPQTLVLTKEEADAYRQLMTALSITSTNLKIVKDALHGGTE